MNTTPFDSMRKLDLCFYEHTAETFSETRNHPWPGWEQLAELIENNLAAQTQLLDLACGNGRFEEFIAQRFPRTRWTANCNDACSSLLHECEIRCTQSDTNNLICIPQEGDILQALQSLPNEGSEKPSAGCLEIAFDQYDLVTCFGFFHHVHSQTMRKKLLELMVDTAKPGGVIAISFWRFADEPALATKAARETEAALASIAVRDILGAQAGDALEEGDFLIGWQGSLQSVRYCHSFTSAEVDDLIASQQHAAVTVARFQADGRTNALNEYVVFQKRAK